MASEVTSDVDNSALRDKLSSLETKYEDLLKKYDALSTIFLPKEPVAQDSDSQTKSEPLKNKEEEAQSTNAVNGDSDKTDKNDVADVPRARILVSKVDPNTGERVETSPQVSTEDDTKGRAFTLRKITHTEAFAAEANRSEITIHDSALWKLLQSKLRHYPYHLFQGEPMTLYSPYEALIHNWKALEDLTKEDVFEERDKQSRKDLKLLFETLVAGSGDPRLDRFFRNRAAAKQKGTVTFEYLWTLFPPGTLVYGKPFQGQDEVFLVQDNPSPWPPSIHMPGERSWRLNCWVYDWNGKQFKRSGLSLKFDDFEGQKSIVALPFYPLDLLEDRDNIQSKLIKRGKEFRNLCLAKEGSRMFEYKGNAIFGKKGFSMVGSDENDDDSRSRSTQDFFSPFGMWPPYSSPPFRRDQAEDPHRPRTVDSRVMVDFSSYASYGPSEGNQVGRLLPSDELEECRCEECKQNEGLAKMYRVSFDDLENTNNTAAEWTDEQLILCPPRVLGYILREKQWAQLQVDHVKNITEDPDDAWYSRLQLADDDGGTQQSGTSSNNSSTKQMLFNLVKSHTISDVQEALEVNDIIPRKGKGLAILLYGPPGVGKTSTAETLALATRKPLFSISVADVGTKAKNAEANLNKIFDLASSWRAILLIDEADVFLESRQRGIGSSVDKNALVSVFLRVLEYYQGILILTTNQIAQFDVAVQSRVHVAIQYESLNKPQKRRIFEGFLEELDKKGRIEEYGKIKEWLEESVYDTGIDGRQIRNIVTSGLGLARAMGDQKLKRAHLQPVFKNTTAFKTAYDREFQKYKTSQGDMIR